VKLSGYVSHQKYSSRTTRRRNRFPRPKKVQENALRDAL
jgi:hypothetical protein